MNSLLILSYLRFNPSIPTVTLLRSVKRQEPLNFRPVLRFLYLSFHILLYLLCYFYPTHNTFMSTYFLFFPFFPKNFFHFNSSLRVSSETNQLFLSFVSIPTLLPCVMSYINTFYVKKVPLNTNTVYTSLDNRYCGPFSAMSVYRFQELQFLD